MNTGQCLNCTTSLQSDFHFCPKCGQKVDTHRLNVKHLSHDIIHYFTHADKSIFRLVWLLLKQPGVTVREYLHGMRKRYFPPVNFFLISVAIMAISVKVFKTFNMDFMLTRRGLSKAGTAGAQLLTFVNTRINWIYIAFIPVFTFLFWIFYTRRKYNYIEHLVAGLYWNGFIVLFLALVISPLMFAFNTLSAFYVISVIFLAAQTLYYSVAYYHLLEYHSVWKFFRSLFISTFVTLISIGIFIFLVVMFYTIKSV
jgi:hypothetical protein